MVTLAVLELDRDILGKVSAWILFLVLEMDFNRGLPG